MYSFFHIRFILHHDSITHLIHVSMVMKFVNSILYNCSFCLFSFLWSSLSQIHRYNNPVTLLWYMLLCLSVFSELQAFQPPCSQLPLSVSTTLPQPQNICNRNNSYYTYWLTDSLLSTGLSQEWIRAWFHR